MGTTTVVPGSRGRARDVVLGLIALLYGSLNGLVLTAGPQVSWVLSLFLLSGSLRLLERIDATLVLTLATLLSLPFVIGGIALLMGRRWGKRTIAVAAGTSGVTLLVGFLLSSLGGLPFFVNFLSVSLRGLPFFVNLLRLSNLAQIAAMPIMPYLNLFTYFGFSSAFVAIPLVFMWFTAVGRPRWLQGDFGRINGWVWGTLFVLALSSPTVMFIIVWLTAPFTHTSNHRLYMDVLYIQAAIYLFTIATSRKWFVTVAMLLLVPSMMSSILIALLYGACFFLGECL